MKFQKSQYYSNNYRIIIYLMILLAIASISCSLFSKIIAEATDVVESANENSQPPFANDLFGKWTGNPAVAITINGNPRGIQSLTFYRDFVIFYMTDGSEDAFSFNFVDDNTLELVNSDQGVLGIIQITKITSENLNLNLVFNHEPDKTYSSTNLSKVSEVTNENVQSLREVIHGKWKTSQDGEYLVDFIANHMAITHRGDASEFSLFRYEFVEPNYLLMEDLFYSGTQPIIVEIGMPNTDTLLLWSIDNYGDNTVAEFFGVMSRVALPANATKRPDKEVLYPLKVSDTQCGYIDYDGEITIEPIYSSCGDFHGSRAIVAPFNVAGEPFDYFGYINSSGEFVIPPQFVGASSFSEGLARVRDLKTQKVGYINEGGEYVIPPQYDSGNDFSDGLAGVNNFDPEWSAFIDNNGAVAFEFDYKDFVHGYWGFHNSLLRTEWGYIDKTGKLVTSIHRSDHRDFSEGVAGIDPWDGDCYYINTNGETVIQTNFDSCHEFSEGLAAVWQDNPFTCGYINKDGELGIGLWFEQCSPFSEGRAVVKVNDQTGYIDIDGNYIFLPEYLNYGGYFHEGLARISIANRWGYINSDGNYILKP